jgi:uncharacterized phage protein gp47/JayE
MPDSIGVNGLEVSTAAELISDLVNGFNDPFTGVYIPGFNAIYSVDINVDSNSSDGQIIGLFAQMAVDLRELLVSINNSFDPDQAQGILLDQRCAINNIKRKGGTYTVQPIDIGISSTVTLQGLDGNYDDPNGTGYTVQDSSGNQFILAATATLTANLTSVDFRAKDIGAVSVPINTITNPITIEPGVVSVNNSSAALTVGINQETDGAFRIRRAQSPALNTSGNAQGLQAKLLALPGITEAQVYQNRTGTTDANGTPGHCLWVVAAGGSDEEIATLIYQTISDGCNMRGMQSYIVTTPNGSLFTAYWDNPTPEPLFIEFTIKTTVPGFDFAIPAIQNAMAAALVYGIGQYAETSSITSIAAAAIAAQGGGGVPVLVQISNDDASWTDFLEPSTLATEFTVAGANISITVI